MHTTFINVVNQLSIPLLTEASKTSLEWKITSSMSSDTRGIKWLMVFGIEVLTQRQFRVRFTKNSKIYWEI